MITSTPTTSRSTTVPRLVTVEEACAYQGPTRVDRVGDYIVAWLDTSNLTRPTDPLPGLSASPQWVAAHGLLIAYVAVTGTFPTKDTIVNGYALGKWVQRQRTAYGKRAPRPDGTPHPLNEQLPDDKVAVLEAVPGWAWKARRGRPLMHDTWFLHLADYLPLRALAAGIDPEWDFSWRFYYDWEIRQHDAYRDGEMPTYRRVLLAAVPWWAWRTTARPYGNEPTPVLSDIDPVALAEAERFTDVNPQRLAEMIGEAIHQIAAASPVHR